MKTPTPPRSFVPTLRLWPGDTFVCIASGPSLTVDDVEFVRGKARIIAVNNGVVLAPWADVLWATDARWWRWFETRPEFTHARKVFAGLKYSLWVGGLPLPKDVHVLRNDGYTGLCLDPSGVRNGKNGGYAALNLAMHLGAARVILLGYDCHKSGGKDHWHPDHPTKMPNPYQSWRRLFDGMAPELKKAGVEAINCSRDTSLTCFPRLSLRDALPETQEAVA